VVATVAGKKLGRIKPKAIYDTPQFKILVLYDGRTKVVPKLGHYRTAPHKAKAAVVTTNWLAKMTAAVAEFYDNQNVGDCVIASILKVFGGWTGNELGTPALSSDAEANQTYVTICGPGDQGCVITDVLDYAKSTGVPVGGAVHKIQGYVAIDNTNQEEVQAAVSTFGPAVKLGINLPQAWYDAATGSGFKWDVTSSPSIGGHDVDGIDVNAAGLVFGTWAMWGSMTWAALADKAIVEEAYCLLGPDWDSLAGIAPNGINAAALAADLALLGQGVLPIPGVGPTPVVPPVVPPTGATVAGCIAAVSVVYRTHRNPTQAQIDAAVTGYFNSLTKHHPSKP
jgi:hypothetical protein